MKKEKWSLQKFRNKYVNGRLETCSKWFYCSIVVLMIAILITSILSTTSLQIIEANFDWFNIFTANMKFRPKTLTEIGYNTLNKINDLNFDIKLLPMSETKFIYEYDRNINPDDLKYLLRMQVDKSKTLWKNITVSTYLLKYPEISESISIIWLIMTIIYQYGHKDSNWGLPEGWRIVVPSILVFFVMSFLTGTVTLMATKTMNNFCNELKKELIQPELVRCGLAIAHLRFHRDTHEFNFDTILNLYHHMNYAKSICWSIAFIVILLRFLFAIDFQLIELKMIRYDKPIVTPKVIDTDRFEPLPSDIETIKSSMIYDLVGNANKDEPEDENEEDPKKTKTSFADEKQKMLKYKGYDDDEESEDFQSANSIMMRTPLMGSGDYIDKPK